MLRNCRKKLGFSRAFRGANWLTPGRFRLFDKWRKIAAATAGGGRWHWLGYLLSGVIIAVAATSLIRILAKIRPDDVLAALQAKPATHIAFGALMMAGSYLSLTLYDFFALRTIGRNDVPYRVAATAGFASYAIGHNLGATAITCGIVRYHVYSSKGLGLIDVAKICFITGLTFWLGNICVLGTSLAVEPGAAQPITQFPQAVNRALGFTLLAASLVYVAFVSSGRRVIGRQNWTIRLPGGRSTLLQIAIGIFDLTCCILAMHALLPPSPQIGVFTLATVFVTALLLGYASHTPGGLGVFDAAMLIGLPQFPPEQLLASLLLFRLIGYIAPGLLAVALLAVRQLVIAKHELAPR